MKAILLTAKTSTRRKTDVWPGIACRSYKPFDIDELLTSIEQTID
jgi:hypothetical protein